MKTTTLSMLLFVLCAANLPAALAQVQLSPEVKPPVIPPPLPLASYDPNPDPPVEPPAPPKPKPSELDTAPPGTVIPPPESGVLVTPGYYISGCLQLPVATPEGPITPQPPWPFGTIPFEFDSNVPAANRALFQTAMNEVHDYCGVDFRARNQFDLAWLHIQTSAGNNAPIGFFPGEHTVNILNFNIQYIMCHELFHVLGVWHEQSRTDRDNFVIINTGNISQNLCSDANNNPAPCNSQFQIENQSVTFGMYNFDSIMHYKRAAFSSGTSDTITVQPAYAGIWQGRIGQRDHRTFGDRSTAIRLYQPGWAKIADIHASTNGNGSWSLPKNNFPDAYNAAPAGGDVIILAGYYTGLSRWSSPRRVHAPDGGVRIGQ